MKNMILMTTLLAIYVIIIGYGQAQKFEGTPCTLHDGGSGVCRNVEHCDSIKKELRSGMLRYEHIVECSFVGSVQIACCADESPLPSGNPPTASSPTTTDFAFIGMRRQTTKISGNVFNEYLTSQSSNQRNQNIRMTTSTPIRSTSINPFWQDWSALQPTGFNDGTTQANSFIGQTSGQQNMKSEKLRATPPTERSDLAPWMIQVLHEHKTTTKPSPNNDIRTTTRTSHVGNEMPSWMQEVLNELSTTTTRTGSATVHSKTKTLSGGSHFFGDSNGDSHHPIRNSDYDNPTTGHVTKKPVPTDSQTKNRYGTGSKAEAACELYSALAPNSLGIKILGGVEAALGEFPWMAALGFDAEDKSFDCGGTIISERYILTAAHCTPSRRRPIKVRLGKVYLYTNDDDATAVDINIQEIIQHPAYKASTKKNDIALIRLAEPIKFTEDLRPACLQTNMNDARPDVGLYVTGWGTTSRERTVRPNVLLKTNVTSMPLNICNQTLYDWNREANQPSLRNGISESQCCAFDPQARNDACQGDSGGPLQMFEENAIGTVIGVVSFGIGCGTSLPGVYTRVAYYLDWIESIVWPNSF